MDVEDGLDELFTEIHQSESHNNKVGSSSGSITVLQYEIEKQKKELERQRRQIVALEKTVNGLKKVTSVVKTLVVLTNVRMKADEMVFEQAKKLKYQ